jgi:outer membrane cobalamin receptor
MKATNHPLTGVGMWTSLASTGALVCALFLSTPALLNAAEGQADGKAQAKSEKVKAPAKPVKVKAPAKAPVTTPKVVVTGTRIPRQIKETGHIRETTSPVYIVDRKEIERTGAMTVADVLRRLPFAR